MLFACCMHSTGLEKANLLQIVEDPNLITEKHCTLVIWHHRCSYSVPSCPIQCSVVFTASSKRVTWEQGGPLGPRFFFVKDRP